MARRKRLIAGNAGQPQLFSPDHHVVRYIADNGSFELTFDGAVRSFWLTQRQIAELFGLDVSVVSRHIANFRQIRGADAEAVIANFAITASDGKRYEVEHYNHQIVTFVGYRAQQNDRTIAFQRFAEKLIADALEAASRRAIERARLGRAQAVTGYLLAGRSREWAETRVDTKDTFKALTAQIARVCDNKRAFGVIAQREYVELLGATASELKRILGTTSIRDALPELTLTYLKTAEVTLAAILERQQRMSLAQLQDAARSVLIPLGRILHDVCEALGIDRVTGQPHASVPGTKGKDQ